MNDEQQHLIIELALAIEDPAGIEEIRLASALLFYAMHLPKYARQRMTQMLEAGILEFERKEKPCRNSN